MSNETTQAMKNMNTRKQAVDMLAFTFDITTIESEADIEAMYFERYGQPLPEDYAYELMAYIIQAKNEGKQYVGTQRFYEFIFNPRS